jgi:hypothetical protein
MTELDRLYWDLEIDRYDEGHSIHTAGGHSSLYSLRVIRADLSAGNYGEEAMLKTQVVLSDEKGQTVAVTRIVPDTAYPRCEWVVWDGTRSLPIDLYFPRFRGREF